MTHLIDPNEFLSGYATGWEAAKMQKPASTMLTGSVPSDYGRGFSLGHEDGKAGRFRPFGNKLLNDLVGELAHRYPEEYPGGPTAFKWIACWADAAYAIQIIAGRPDPIRVALLLSISGQRSWKKMKPFLAEFALDGSWMRFVKFWEACHGA